MVINFVGNFQNGYVGEQADQVHLAREMETLGHTVRRIPQDEWREHVLDGKPYPHVPSDLKSDANIITKWHHFSTGEFAHALRKQSGGSPVFYWVWDYMWDWPSMGFPPWHIEMAKAANLYLTNEEGIRSLYAAADIKPYYFPYDVCDGDLPIYRKMDKKYDVVFTGSYLELGHRIAYLREINKVIPITIFSWNYEEWASRGFKAYPAVYGEAYNEIIAQSKVILGFSVEPHCWGYWSNRVGKVLRAGGVLLYEYAPGMELMVDNAVDYFSSLSEAIGKINFWLSHEEERLGREKHALDAGHRFTSAYRVRQLMILIDRYIKTGGKGWYY